MPAKKPADKKLRELLQITEQLNHIKDIDSLLDRILYEARLFANADAGSIFLISGKKLQFSYVQNDSLAKIDRANNRFIYSTPEINIDKKSIAGYVASTGKALMIDDAYKIDKTVSYSFNQSFDMLSSYRTKSILAIPLVTRQEKTIGVMQIINAKDKEGHFIAFKEEDKMYTTFFANNASVAIERAKMTRQIILRMIKMAELRDPKETGNHVNRVGAYSIEIYEQWAKQKKLPRNEIKRTKDTLRIAAMLHDVGKVAISDTILKKPAKLTDDEYNTMKTHTICGARLFDEAVSELDTMAAEIAINHHERWDGQGYPGKKVDMDANAITISHGKKAEEIPIVGRIVALADVYDALISKRAYKDAWQEEDVLAYIKDQSGKQFDPEVTEAFIEIYDVIKAIRKKYLE